VYPESPAGRAGIPRYGNILNVNGVEITGDRAFNIYDSVLTQNKEISITVAYAGDTNTYELTKEDVYAPTVFVDTLNGIEIITITGFKLNTVDKKNGTLGELTTYLESTRNSTAPRLIDLRGNPGGHVNHCTAMADLFMEKGNISTRSWRSFAGDGTPLYNKVTVVAKPGDAGEKKKFVAIVNGGSASCAEIFAVALQEGAEIPIAGTVSYGKGIGQSTWKTMAGGLSLITNLEFLTPKGNSYHKKGIIPDYPCTEASLQCGFDALESKYGKKGSSKTAFKKSAADANEPQILSRYNDLGGAIIEGEE
jgi:C-terminal peptidase prc